MSGQAAGLVFTAAVLICGAVIGEFLARVHPRALPSWLGAVGAAALLAYAYPTPMLILVVLAIVYGLATDGPRC